MGAIAASFTDKSEPKAVIANGIKINGEKYMTIEASDDSLKAKKVRFASQTTHTPVHPLCISLTACTRLRTDTNTHAIGQGGRRRLQDYPGAADRTPLCRCADA